MADIAQSHTNTNADKSGLAWLARNKDRLLPLSAAVGLILLWQLVVWGFSIPTYMAPSPVQVLNAFGEDAATLWNNFWPTLFEALLGFIFGNLVAMVLAVLFVYSETTERAFFPIAVFVNTIPIIAVAPTTEPDERSMPPVMMTCVTPMAMMPTTETCRIMMERRCVLNRKLCP